MRVEQVISPSAKLHIDQVDSLVVVRMVRPLTQAGECEADPQETIQENQNKDPQEDKSEDESYYYALHEAWGDDCPTGFRSFSCESCGGTEDSTQAPNGIWHGKCRGVSFPFFSISTAIYLLLDQVINGWWKDLAGLEPRDDYIVSS